MNKNIDKNNLNDVITVSKKILKVLYVLILALAAYVSLIIIKELGIVNVILVICSILSPLFIGVIIAWLLNPFVKWLETKKIRRVLGTGLAYIIFVAALFLLVKALLPLLYNQGIDLIENLPNIFSTLKEWLNKLLSNFDSDMINIYEVQRNLYVKLDEFSTNLTTVLPKNIINILTVTISSVSKIVIGFVIGFFLLTTCDNLGNNIIEFVPRRYRKGVNKLGRNVNQALRNYVNGALLDSSVVFVVSTIVFAILGLKSPLLFGLFCGLMNVIPYVGPYIGGAPAVIVAFSQSFGLGIAVLIAIVIIQTIEGSFLQTMIISKTTKLNPVIIIVGLLIFGHFFGIVGMLLSTPIISVIKVVIKYFDDKYDILNFE